MERWHGLTLPALHRQRRPLPGLQPTVERKNSHPAGSSTARPATASAACDCGETSRGAVRDSVAACCRRGRVLLPARGVCWLEDQSTRPQRGALRVVVQSRASRPTARAGQHRRGQIDCHRGSLRLWAGTRARGQTPERIRRHDGRQRAEAAQQAIRREMEQRGGKTELARGCSNISCVQNNYFCRTVRLGSSAGCKQAAQFSIRTRLWSSSGCHPVVHARLDRARQAPQAVNGYELQTTSALVYEEAPRG